MSQMLLDNLRRIIGGKPVHTTSAAVIGRNNHYITFPQQCLLFFIATLLQDSVQECSKGFGLSLIELTVKSITWLNNIHRRTKRTKAIALRLSRYRIEITNFSLLLMQHQNQEENDFYNVAGPW